MAWENQAVPAREYWSAATAHYRNVVGHQLVVAKRLTAPTNPNAESNDAWMRRMKREHGIPNPLEP